MTMIYKIGMLNPDIMYTDTGRAYTCHLFAPIQTALERAVTTTKIKDSISRLLPMYAPLLMSEIDWMAPINLIRNEVLQRCIKTLESQLNSPIVTAWDLLREVKSSPYFRDLVPMEDFIDILPVTVTIGPNVFTHWISHEFVRGLLVYASQICASYKLQLYGTRLHEYWMSNKSMYVLGLKDGTGATFDQIDFLTGFATGALWSRQDPSDKIEALYRCSDNVQMSITWAPRGKVRMPIIPQ